METAMRPRYLNLALLLTLLIGIRVGIGQEKEALFLPQDAQLLDERTVRGTTEYPLQPGLSRMTFPDSDITYYVINEVAALQGRLSDQLSDIWRNDSDISIRYDLYRSEFVHLRLRSENPDVRYFRVERALLFQLYEYFDAGGYANGGGSIDFLEYRMPIDACPGLDAAIRDMLVVLQSSTSSIGSQSESVPSDESDVFVTDAISYQLRARMGKTLEGRFSVSENNGRSLYDPVRAIMVAIRECSSEVEPESRRHDF
jgi:hypothetical protein